MQELAILASRALTTQRQFTAVADNVANVNTHGFRKLDLQFKEVFSRPKGHPTASYVADRALFLSRQQGGLEKTSNPLDVALNGDGFFAVSVNGTTQYTRKGNFLIDNVGTLVNTDGYPVLDNSGAPIQLPTDAKNISIAGDGAVSSNAGLIASLGVYSFTDADLKLLQRAGASNFVPQLGAAATPATSPRVVQGFLEASNVNATEEMVNMELVSRAYQNSLKLLKTVEDTEERAIRTLGTVN